MNMQIFERVLGIASFPGRAGEGKNGDCLRMRGCPTICGGQDLYVYSPCNVGRYITCTLPHTVSRVLNNRVR